ncbi:unnamed protein product [Brassicogethes aeneus]|uniref:EF-hand domain-containing protein n=1 Tax=Brassicogethes aeneus TaxID=1431903 RepID=A0A9P0FK39_BRAAE|nr:unnamed protein product [Brassicogethes aeneus]
MYYVAIVFCLIITIEARGPHHPRGDKIVKRHVHYRPTKENGEKLTQDDNLLHDREHIQEHLEELVSEPDLTNMTDEQLEFYYFHLHDVDKNNQLDGLEILRAIYHIDHHEHEGAGDGIDENEEKEDHDVETESSKYYVDLIDEVLSEDDTDNDGFLSYPEYVEGRKRKKPNGKDPGEIKMLH